MQFEIAGVVITDLVLSVTVPFVVYWVTALFYETLSYLQIPWVEQYRIHPAAAEKQYNLVTRRKVVPVVLAQHITQAVLGLVTLEAPPDLSQRTLGGEIVRFLCAMVVLDAWQFAFHRLFHEVDWLYKHVHVWHHKMYVPFAYGGLYQHPFEMLIMDTLSGLVSVSAVGAAPLTAMFFWSISYIKVVSDHSGYRFPVNLTNLPGINNAEYHDVHHSPTGIRHNFSQPWFTYWDVFYGCSKDPLDGQSLPGKKAV